MELFAATHRTHSKARPRLLERGGHGGQTAARTPSYSSLLALMAGRPQHSATAVQHDWAVLLNQKCCCRCLSFVTADFCFSPLLVFVSVELFCLCCFSPLLVFVSCFSPFFFCILLFAYVLSLLTICGMPPNYTTILCVLFVCAKVLSDA